MKGTAHKRSLSIFTYVRATGSAVGRESRKSPDNANYFILTEKLLNLPPYRLLN